MDPELRVYINMQSCPLPLYTKVTHTPHLLCCPFKTLYVLIGNGTIINVALLTWQHDEAISNVQYTDLVTIYVGVLVLKHIEEIPPTVRR